MDLLLTHGFFLSEDSKELRIVKPYVPLGILYLTSHLRSKGFSVEFFDTTFSSREELFDVLRKTPPSVLGVYANLMTRPAVIETLRVAKDAGWKIVVGGPEPAAYVAEYLAAGADVVVVGEGEVTMEELLPALRSGTGGDLESVKGIAFLDREENIHWTPTRPQIPDLDRQPWPAREVADIEKYLQTWREHHGRGSVSLITARGCPYHCRWCSHAVYGKTHRRRKPAAVVDELDWLLERYQPDMLWIADDVFTIHHSWIFQYAAELKRRHLRIPFECISRADRLNSRVVDALAEMNCFRIWIGSESGSQRVLDAMQRGVTVEEVQKAVELCRSRGIDTGMFLMWGYEGEQLEDIEATVEHVKRSNPDVFLTTVAYPIKGTPYFDEVAGRAVSAKPWAQGSDRDYQIRGRHSPRFYQFADQLLRSEVELARLARGNGEGVEGAFIAELRERVNQARDGLHLTFSELEA